MEYKGVLVIAEGCGREVHRVSNELLNKGRELSARLGTNLSCVILGKEGINVEELCYRGADKVFYMKDECFGEPEEYLFKENLISFIRQHKPEIVLIGATNFGRSLGPRIAAALRTGLTADCTDLRIDDEGRLIQIRPAFSNNIFAHIKTVTYPQMATIRYKEFEEAEREEKREVNIEILMPYVNKTDKTYVTHVYNEDNFDITQAEIVVAGGRGIKRKEDLKLLQELADLLGGKVGATRALVDSGMIGSSRQIGYSGNRVKPRIYIACGISGAPQHIAGMKDSEIIIAINSDSSAPIFSIADYGCVGDIYEVIPRLIEEIKSDNGGSKWMERL